MGEVFDFIEFPKRDIVSSPRGSVRYVWSIQKFGEPLVFLLT